MFDDKVKAAGNFAQVECFDSKLTDGEGVIPPVALTQECLQVVCCPTNDHCNQNCNKIYCQDIVHLYLLYYYLLYYLLY